MVVLLDMNIVSKSTKFLFCLQSRKAEGLGNNSNLNYNYNSNLNYKTTVMDTQLILRHHPVTVIDCLNEKEVEPL